MPKGVPNKRYMGEFKQMVVETMMREKLSYKETAAGALISVFRQKMNNLELKIGVCFDKIKCICLDS